MKKILLLPIIIIILASPLIETATALAITLTLNPEVIPSPGGTTTITVTCDQAGSGWIIVITPGLDGISAVYFTIPTEGGSVSKIYPTDFPKHASTAEMGEYKVFVWFSGNNCKYGASFWVSFTVVPQTPLGVIAVIAACFAALGIKRVQAEKKRVYR